MTGQRVPGESIKADQAASSPPSTGGTESILESCDALVGEVGRRRHLFSWLRDPAAAEPAWLPVDAYYPRRRLVVLCDPDPAHAPVYRERVPAHGLALMEVATGDLGSDDAARREALGRKIADAEPPRQPQDDATRPRLLRRESREARPPGDARPSRDRQPFATLTTLMQPAAPPPPAPRPLRGSQAAAAQRAVRLLSARRALSPLAAVNDRPSPPRAARSAPARLASARERSTGHDERATVQVQAVRADSALIGLALIAVLCVEAYLGVIRVALGTSDVVLGIAIVIDACARAFGAIAALRLEREPWAWGCVIGGSPVVAAFALFQRSGPVEAEPAPLAGLLSLVAIGLAALALVAQLL